MKKLTALIVMVVAISSINLFIAPDTYAGSVQSLKAQMPQKGDPKGNQAEAADEVTEEVAEEVTEEAAKETPKKKAKPKPKKLKLPK
jgi:pyruvoyl-dependent arginine decarboxylase (PvlArgDC)